MFNVIRPTPLSLMLSVLALALTSTACEDPLATASGPAAGTDDSNAALQGLPFSRSITPPELEEILGTGPVRVEIELRRGSLVAREVEVKSDDEIDDEEEIESRVTDIDAAGGLGTLVLELGGLEVAFDDGARFRSEDSDHLTFDEFVDRVRAALSVGTLPAIEAKRPPPAQPQDPDVSTFHATELKLDDEADEPETEINIDEDNFLPRELNDPQSPDGRIAVLGLEIELRIGEGETELEDELDDILGEVEFEGIVRSVDLLDESLILNNGAVVRLVDGTDVEGESGEDDQLTSLAEVATVLDAGGIVEADGKGVVEIKDPLTIVAIEIEFEIEDDDDDVPGTDEFEGEVRSVDEAAGSFTLTDGTTVTVSRNQFINPDGDLVTLGEVADAIAGGTTVRTEGRGQVDPADSLTIAAVRVKFEVDEDEDDGEDDDDDEDDLTKAGEFENFVATVDVPTGSFTLANATVVRLVVGTEIKESGGSDALSSLNAVADDIDAGLAVESKGKGVVEATAPLTIVADEVEFRRKN